MHTAGIRNKLFQQSPLLWEAVWIPSQQHKYRPRLMLVHRRHLQLLSQTPTLPLRSTKSKRHQCKPSHCCPQALGPAPRGSFCGHVLSSSLTLGFQPANLVGFNPPTTITRELLLCAELCQHPTDPAPVLSLHAWARTAPWTPQTRSTGKGWDPSGFPKRQD